jgi:hypothetical protein
MDELVVWKAHLESNGVPTRGPISHPGFRVVSLYFDDPWGHQLEITSQHPDFETAKAEAIRHGGYVVSGALSEEVKRGASSMGGPQPSV